MSHIELDLSVQPIELDLSMQPILNGMIAEASAGTGKTYSVAALLVRELATDENLRISEVMVTTFTRIAAGELRDRIRGASISVCEQLRRNSADKDDTLPCALLFTFALTAVFNSGKMTGTEDASTKNC